MTASGDRTVHAKCAGFEVVRYDRSGKWYVESRNPDRQREHVGVGEAARRALAAETLGGTTHLGRPGGRAFDRAVRSLREREEAEWLRALNIVFREPLDEYAHDRCIQLERAGVSVAQESLL